jgi:hypothetical protein
VPGLQVRWRGLRRRGTFPDPGRDLPQWEAQILDALSSLAIVSAERWVMAGPVSGSSSAAIVSAAGALQPGWLLRVAPTGLVTDIPLPDLGREGTGRMVAVQHTGARRSIIRLGWAGEYVAACTSPGQVAVCVWDGTAWMATSGRVEWTLLQPQALTPVIDAAPLVSQAIGNWGANLYCFPKGADTNTWGAYVMPRGWVGTEVLPDVTVLPLVSQNANALFNVLSVWLGKDTTPALVNFPGSTPQTQAQTGLTVAVTTANYGQQRTIPAAVIATPISLLSTLDATVLMTIQRTGSLGGDTYTTQYAGTNNNIALVSSNLRVQVCGTEATMVI